MRALFAFGLVASVAGLSLAPSSGEGASPIPLGPGPVIGGSGNPLLGGGSGGNGPLGGGNSGNSGSGSGSGSGTGLTGILGGSGSGSGSGSGTGLLGGGSSENSGSGSSGTGLLGGSGSGSGSGSGTGLLGGSGTSGLLGNLPIIGGLLSGDLLSNLPIVGNLLKTVGGVLGELLNNILINVGIILNAVLEIAEDALGAVNVIVNGLLTDVLDDETIQSILNILPPSVKSLVVNLVEAVKCIVNDLQAAVPAVQKAVIQLIGLLVSPTFDLLDANSQLSAILNIIGQLTQEEVTMVNTILQRLADALNNKGCSTGPVTMPTAPGLPGFSLPAIGGGNGGMTPSIGGGLGGMTPTVGGGLGEFTLSPISTSSGLGSL